MFGISILTPSAFSGRVRFACLLFLAINTSVHGDTSSSAALPDQRLSITSWNIKHLGRAHLDIKRVVRAIGDSEMVVFEEVNTSSSGKLALTQIAKVLAEVSKERICTGLSEIPSGSEERFAYLWRDSKISYVKTDGTIVETCPSTAFTIRLGVKNAEKILREPAYGTFYWKEKKARFVLAAVHLRPSGKKPQLEVAPLFDSFLDVKGPIIFAGDFNLDSSNSAFESARRLGFRPAMRGVKTSLKRKKRELSKPYDNFWFRNFQLGSVEVIKLFDLFPELSQKAIYNEISDHCPIKGSFTLDLESEIANRRK